eukprot:Phypoly_transcript_05188.p1 GENE.Phypoly_transcript_05188~~Phypoly_transcript_05188.p1  ORF type:complete len:427 (+),score=47.06 Phypoly_transcript_05188:416-1696(+)
MGHGETSPLLSIHAKSINIKPDANNTAYIQRKEIDVTLDQQPKLYAQRWVTLMLFMLVTMSQCAAWITYSSVADTAMQVYNIKKSAINLLAAFGAIAFFPLSFHSSWAIEALGLRKTLVTAALLVGSGAVLRSLAWKDEWFFLVYIGQFLNASAGPILMTSSPVLSAHWFGPHERTLATGMCTTANNTGVPVAFLIGLFVTNRDSFFYMIWAEAIFGLLLAFVIVVFFANKPPTPPSFSNQLRETKERATVLQFLRDTWVLICDPNCFNIIFTTMLTAGSNSGWSSMLILILVPLQFTQQQAQWIGFISGAVGLIGGVLVGKFHDHVGNFKITIFGLYVASMLAYLYFTLATTSILLQFFVTPFWGILLVIIIGNFCLNALYPLGYEALTELSYPISETVGAGALSLFINIGCLIYLIFGDYIPPR